MDFVNGLSSSAFSLMMSAIGWMGWLGALAFASAVFGILALLVFKQISFQGGIKGVKDKIKGAMIEIRLYQNDLAIVTKAVGKVLGRNVQYMALNFGPMLPLFVPFGLVAAQMVVWFGFVPIPVWNANRGEWMPGKGHEIVATLDEDARGQVRDIEVALPDTLELKSPIVRNERKGVIAFEVIAVAAGDAEIVFTFPDGTTDTKQIVTGDAHDGPLSGIRGSSFEDQLLWPSEGSYADSPLHQVKFDYPARSLPWMIDGPLGIIGYFLVFSMIAGVAILKPLNIQI